MTDTTDTAFEAMEAVIYKQALAMLHMATRDLQPNLTKAEAAELGGDPEENFDGWLPMTLASGNQYYKYTLSELNTIRNAVRIMIDTNEIAKNVKLHYRNFIVGSGIQVDVMLDGVEDDPEKLATLKPDTTVVKMRENWKLFEQANDLTKRFHDWIDRAHADGECFVRLFDGENGTPKIRFMEPAYLDPAKNTAPYGIQFVKDDAETPETYFYKLPDATNAEPVDAVDVIRDIRNVRMGAPRGVSSYWPCMTNFRRLEKILVNSSVLAAVQAAITMVRKHTTSTAAKVDRMLKKQSDGINRTDTTTGKAIVAKKYRPGTVLDASSTMEYEFPSHSINAASFVEIATHELTHIAANFVLPAKWLMGDEPVEPLTPGSPTIAMLETEQYIMFSHIEELFWRVQERMGINVETTKPLYTLMFNGKRLAVGKALDEARVDEILQRVGSVSPQSISAKNGYVWAVERANTIKHRKTLQEGEVMAGDAGNTAPGSAASASGTAAGAGGDGTTKRGGGQRSAGGDGGGKQ